MPSCDCCQQDCTPEELRDLAGKKVCEDCYIDGIELSQTCDPWAVHIAKSTLPAQGLPVLSPLQQQFFDLVQKVGQISPPEAAARLGVTETELRREFATLRHLELLKGAKTPDGIVVTLFHRG